MKKFILLVLIFCTASAFGQDVSQSLAIDIATRYYERVKNDKINEHTSRMIADNKAKNARVPELISPFGLANMWLVPVEDGWVLVSTNTRTTPVLAHYQTNQKPEYDRLAPGEKFLLEWYERSIAYVRDSCPECKRNWKWNSYQGDAERNKPQVRSTIIVPPLTHPNVQSNR